MHIYNERLQLIINGNVLSSRKPNGKVRLQFLGIRVEEPPAAPYTLGSAGSDMMVSTFDQITEINHDPSLRRHQQYLGQCDGWVRPWAVRALSGHTVHYDPEKNLMELDPHKFAISPSLSLVNQIGGAYHATSCRNLLSIVERGILPGNSVQDDQMQGTIQGDFTATMVSLLHGTPETPQRNNVSVVGETMRCPWLFSTSPRWTSPGYKGGLQTEATSS